MSTIRSERVIGSSAADMPSHPRALQRAFVDRTTTRDKIMQIITANLTVSVIGNLVYLTSMAYINGARGVDRISLAVKTNFMKVMRITWATSPISIAVAQNYLPPEIWGESHLSTRRQDASCD